MATRLREARLRDGVAPWRGRGLLLRSSGGRVVGRQDLVHKRWHQILLVLEVALVHEVAHRQGVLGRPRVVGDAFPRPEEDWVVPSD